MKTSVVFARHAQSWANVELREALESAESGLTPAGKEQALKLGLVLRNGGMPIGAVVSSSMKRAVETAKIVSDILGLEPLPPDPRFDERRFPVWTHPKLLLKMLREPAPDIEKSEAVAMRFSEALFELEPTSPLLVISHKLAIDAYFEARGLESPRLHFAQHSSVTEFPTS